MLSLQFIREHPDLVRKAIADKGARVDLNALLALDAEVRAMKTEVDDLRRQRNEISASFKSAAPEERPALGARAKEIGARSAEVEARLAEQGGELDALTDGYLLSQALRSGDRDAEAAVAALHALN